MITNEDCIPQLEEYSIETTDIALTAFVERMNGYDLSIYSAAKAKAVAVFGACYLALASGTRVLQSRGADGKSQSFKDKDSLKQLKDFIKGFDDKGIIKDIFISEGNVGFIAGVPGYVCNS